jgi:hypothetical protein
MKTGNSIGEQVVSAQPEEGVTYLQVTDTTCTPAYPTRTHDIMYQGRRAQVTFNYGNPLRLPIDVALKFLKDEAFVVTDEDGNQYDPTPKAPEAAGAEFKLAPDEIVAKLDELTQEALYLRAKQLNGSDHIKKGTPKTELVAFLAAQRLTEAKAAGKAKDDLDVISPGATVGGALTGSALAKLVPDDDETGGAE